MLLEKSRCSLLFPKRHRQQWTMLKDAAFHRRACPLHHNHLGRRRAGSTTPWYFCFYVFVSPEKPLTLKPHVTEIGHSCTIRTRFPRISDEDVSSTRDGYTAWVEFNAAETRSRHLVNTVPVVLRWCPKRFLKRSLCPSCSEFCSTTTSRSASRNKHGSAS